ncbi:hypothetical protein VP01_2239g2 [Puccinia sorghi]|uniref:Uncharacterized protein n=1 Tax=Puccinia sorghi TaxID=27349 RepID=A0A0L6V980_9BASI|nr:hypothetical protein VP01_2239g2 [Puccinia sorghi]
MEFGMVLRSVGKKFIIIKKISTCPSKKSMKLCMGFEVETHRWHCGDIQECSSNTVTHSNTIPSLIHTYPPPLYLVHCIHDNLPPLSFDPQYGHESRQWNCPCVDTPKPHPISKLKPNHRVIHPILTVCTGPLLPPRLRSSMKYHIIPLQSTHDLQGKPISFLLLHCKKTQSTACSRHAGSPVKLWLLLQHFSKSYSTKPCCGVLMAAWLEHAASKPQVGKSFCSVTNHYKLNRPDWSSLLGDNETFDQFYIYISNKSGLAKFLLQVIMRQETEFVYPKALIDILVLDFYDLLSPSKSTPQPTEAPVASFIIRSAVYNGRNLSMFISMIFTFEMRWNFLIVTRAANTQFTSIFIAGILSPDFSMTRFIQMQVNFYLRGEKSQVRRGAMIYLRGEQSTIPLQKNTEPAKTSSLSGAHMCAKFAQHTETSPILDSRLFLLCLESDITLHNCPCSLIEPIHPPHFHPQNHLLRSCNTLCDLPGVSQLGGLSPASAPFYIPHLYPGICATRNIVFQNNLVPLSNPILKMKIHCSALLSLKPKPVPASLLPQTVDRFHNMQHPGTNNLQYGGMWTTQPDSYQPKLAVPSREGHPHLNPNALPPMTNITSCTPNHRPSAGRKIPTITPSLNVAVTVMLHMDNPTGHPIMYDPTLGHQEVPGIGIQAVSPAPNIAPYLHKSHWDYPCKPSKRIVNSQCSSVSVSFSYVSVKLISKCFNPRPLPPSGKMSNNFKKRLTNPRKSCAWPSLSFITLSQSVTRPPPMARGPGGGHDRARNSNLGLWCLLLKDFLRQKMWLTLLRDDLDLYGNQEGRE